MTHPVPSYAPIKPGSGCRLQAFCLWDHCEGIVCAHLCPQGEQDPATQDSHVGEEATQVTIRKHKALWAGKNRSWDAGVLISSPVKGGGVATWDVAVTRIRNLRSCKVPEPLPNARTRASRLPSCVPAGLSRQWVSLWPLQKWVSWGWGASAARAEADEGRCLQSWAPTWPHGREPPGRQLGSAP